MTEIKQVNGVNVTELFETIDAIKAKPELAKFKFKARNGWVRGGHNRTKINEFQGACQRHERKQSFVFDADEPPVLLGQDKGANPVEYALTALAACVTTSIVYHAAARGVEIEEIESVLEGDLDLHGFLGLDESVRNGYQGVRITFKIKADAPEEKLKEICQLGPAYSPVFDIFTNAVPVSVDLAPCERPQPVSG